MRDSIKLLVAAGLVLGVSACDIDQTREGEMPEVEVREGQLPAYDVDTPEVDIGTEQRTIRTPDVDVDMEERQVEVPDVDVTMPDDDDERMQR